MKKAFCIWLAVIFVSVIALTMQGCAKKNAPAVDPEQLKKAGQEEAKKVVVATVNGAPITVDLLVKMMNRLGAKDPTNQTPESAEELKKNALDKLILQELAYQKAKADGIKPEEKFIDEAIVNLKVNVGGEKEYAEFLAQQNVTEAELRAQVQRSLTLEIIFAREVSDKVSIPEDEVKKEYEKEKQRFILPEKVSVTDVFFNAKNADKASRKKANEVLKKIRADKGKDPWKLVLDGAFIVRNTDVRREKEKELYDAAKKLKVGELSGVIKASDGLHIIKLKAYAPEKQLSFDEARGSLEGKFRVPAQQQRLEEWGRELRKDAKIEIKDAKIEITDVPAGEAKEKKN
jgi:parvulin-like peptidyl-prolyl isomerase